MFSPPRRSVSTKHLLIGPENRHCWTELRPFFSLMSVFVCLFKISVFSFYYPRVSDNVSRGKDDPAQPGLEGRGVHLPLWSHRQCQGTPLTPPPPPHPLPTSPTPSPLSLPFFPLKAESRKLSEIIFLILSLQIQNNYWLIWTISPIFFLKVLTHLKSDLLPTLVGFE
jgi:hypothetical protein